MCKLSAHCRIISTDGETSFVTDKEIDDMKSALTSFKGNEQSVGISVGSHVRVTQVQIFCQMKNLLWGLYQVIDQMS